MVVGHGFFEVDGQEGALFVDLPQKGAGLRVAGVCLLVVDVQPLDYVLLSVDAEEILVGVVEAVGFCARVSDHLFDDLFDDRFLNLYYFVLWPFLFQNLSDELKICLGKLGTDKGLYSIFGLEKCEHFPLTGHDLEVIHGCPELLGPVCAAAHELGVFDGH